MMNTQQIDDIVDDALNAAVASIQAAIGQTDGGFAALWFIGQREAVIKSILTDYIRAEIDQQ